MRVVACMKRKTKARRKRAWLFFCQTHLLNRLSLAILSTATRLAVTSFDDSR